MEFFNLEKKQLDSERGSVRARIVQQNTDRGRQDHFHFVGGESCLFRNDLDGFRLPILISRNSQEGPQPDVGVDLEVLNII
jgi:hypothetical protein